MAAWRAGPGAAAYNASKSALSAALEAIRPELDLDGVRVLEVNPGFVRTPMTDKNAFPMPFLVSAEDAAARIVRAIARRKRRIAFPRRAALVMGTLRRMPDWLFDALARRVARSLRRKGALGVDLRERGRDAGG